MSSQSGAGVAGRTTSRGGSSDSTMSNAGHGGAGAKRKRAGQQQGAAAAASSSSSSSSSAASAAGSESGAGDRGGKKSKFRAEHVVEERDMLSKLFGVKTAEEKLGKAAAPADNKAANKKASVGDLPPIGEDEELKYVDELYGDGDYCDDYGDGDGGEADNGNGFGFAPVENDARFESELIFTNKREIANQPVFIGREAVGTLYNREKDVREAHVIALAPATGTQLDNIQCLQDAEGKRFTTN